MSKQGKLHSVGHGDDADQLLLAEARESMYESFWKQASNHYDGEGLEQGVPHTEALEQAMKFSRKKGRQDLSNLVLQVAAGGTTTGDRRRTNSSCPVCGHTDSSEHRLFHCARMADRMDEAEQD